MNGLRSNSHKRIPAPRCPRDSTVTFGFHTGKEHLVYDSIQRFGCSNSQTPEMFVPTKRSMHFHAPVDMPCTSSQHKSILLWRGKVLFTVGSANICDGEWEGSSLLLFLHKITPFCSPTHVFADLWFGLYELFFPIQSYLIYDLENGFNTASFVQHWLSILSTKVVVSTSIWRLFHVTCQLG